MTNTTKLGSRIQIDEETRGTVKYIGNLPGRSGEWLGVEWDNESRGKHNGQVDGVSYFSTVDGKSSGSFLRIEKALPSYSLVEVVQRKYVGIGKENLEEENIDENEEEEMYICVSNSKSKKVELMGKGKLQKRYKMTHLLKIASLCFECISEEGPAEELCHLLPNLTELDLSCSLINDWKIVASIISHLPKLELLNFSVNRFSIPDNGCSKDKKDLDLSRLKSLFLVNCQLSWKQIVTIIFDFQNLEQLRVSGNLIESFCYPQKPLELLSVFHNIKLLDLSNNKINSWEEVLNFGSLKNLESLNLCGNFITYVTYPPDNKCQDLTIPFENLKCILLGDCQINEWESINSLNKFPALIDTRLSGNSLFASVFGGGRYEIIGRICKLVHLNGADISNRERVDCEKRYLSRIAQSIAQGETRESIICNHPRYEELIKIHGVILANSTSTNLATAMKSNVVDVQITCNAVAKGAKIASLSKKLPLSMTVGSLKQLIEKLFNIKKENIILLLQSPGAMAMPEDISNTSENQKLSDLYLTNGHEIFIIDKIQN